MFSTEFAFYCALPKTIYQVPSFHDPVYLFFISFACSLNVNKKLSFSPFLIILCSSCSLSLGIQVAAFSWGSQIYILSLDQQSANFFLKS